MLRLQQVPLVGYRPYTATSRRLSAPVGLGQVSSSLSPAVLGVGLAIDAGLSGIVSWVGFYAGNNARGLLSVLGYGVGVVGALGVLGAVLEGGALLFGKVPNSSTVKAPAAPAASEAVTVPA